MATIGVIDYGMGNLHSLGKALDKVAGTARILISSEPAELARCDRLVLPGVGGVGACMAELQKLRLDSFVQQAVRNTPLLGICLGMQVLLTNSSENEGVPTLGLINGAVLRFPDPPPAIGSDSAERLKVPHMGWNRVLQTRTHPLWAGIDDNSWFYFVHSYYATPKLESNILGVSEYGRRFAAAVARDNIAGVQFHPEKSQAAGLRLLTNFTTWNGNSPD